MLRTCTAMTLGALLTVAQGAVAQVGLGDLPTLSPGRTATKNALWLENPLSTRFLSTKRVVVADIQGPATITMIHFALPGAMKLNRDAVLKIFWDEEKDPSVNCPLVDFFCDPAGTREEVNTALVNKRQGWNAYFPMPFRKSAHVELVYDGPLPPGNDLWGQMPCYSYVMYRTLENVPEATGYFHAYWRQEGVILAKQPYVVLEAKGSGKFVGWNVTVRHPGWKGQTNFPYPVDENAEFFVDGEKEPSVQFQGLEDAFGFSWGFPPTQSQFPLTGWFPFLKGACAYQFFVQDAIRFEKSLRAAIAFGKLDLPYYHTEYSKPENRLQFSSTAYWYQVEPHSPLPALPPAAERAPAAEDHAWAEKEKPPAAKSSK